jgi:hypothetical protein
MAGEGDMEARMIEEPADALIRGQKRRIGRPSEMPGENETIGKVPKKIGQQSSRHPQSVLTHHQWERAGLAQDAEHIGVRRNKCGGQADAAKPAGELGLNRRARMLGRAATRCCGSGRRAGGWSATLLGQRG